MTLSVATGWRSCGGRYGRINCRSDKHMHTDGHNTNLHAVIAASAAIATAITATAAAAAAAAAMVVVGGRRSVRSCE